MMYDDKLYRVLSNFEKREYTFREKDDAIKFFKAFIGDAILFEGKNILEYKQMIKTFEDLVYAGLFSLCGIVKDGSNAIREEYLRPPDAITIDHYTKLLQLYKSPYKGVAIVGRKGVGKTTIMRFFSTAVRSDYVEGIRPFENVHVKKIVESFLDIKIKYECYNLFKITAEHKTNLNLEDLGRDNGERVNYGDRVNIIGDIIEDRYNSFIEYGLKTHFTSNCDESRLEKYYGDIVVDRLMEMTSFYVIEDRNSYRRV